jgi:hypothetical protein
MRQKAEKKRLDLQIAAEAAQEARIREAAEKAAKNPKNATTHRKLTAPQQATDWTPRGSCMVASSFGLQARS